MTSLSRRELFMAAGGAALASGAIESGDPVLAFIEQGIADGTYPGCAIVASRHGRIRIERHLGTCMTLMGPRTRVTSRTMHALYSYSKLVSATVIVMLQEQGVIAYDMPVRTYIPEFAGGGKDGITVRHLMTHAAGIPNPPGLGMVRTPDEWRKGVEAVCAAEVEWEPGTRTAYHGISGLFVVAEAILRKTGERSWDAICRRMLFDPIGAKSLTFSAPPDSAPLAFTPQPKETPKSHFEGAGFAGHPSGGCMGTARDALKVLQLHLNRGKWGSRRLISEAALDDMHRIQYSRQIAVARAAGREPAHETWGLGPLIRGDGPKQGGHDWFGFGSRSSPAIFGHAGIDTVIGVADPQTQIALMFMATDSPKPPEKTVPLRNGVTDRVFEALGQVSSATT
ncbi:MAG: beta-lactamase family protein [Chthonomonadales bacterium]|nr:beta-lactamase family protein [Chthonomonadales bacterium]